MSITLSIPPAIVQEVQYYDALIVSAAEKLGCHEIVGEFLANTYRSGGEIGNTLLKVYWMCRCSHSPPRSRGRSSRPWRLFARKRDFARAGAADDHERAAAV